MNKKISDLKSNRLEIPQDKCKLSTNMCSFQSAQSLQSFQSMMNVPIPSRKALFQTNDNRQYIRLATYGDRTKARQSSEYLNHLLGIQKANITNLQESNMNQNIEEDFTTPLRTHICR